MKIKLMALLCLGAALTSQSAVAQTNVRVRGTLTAFDGNVLSVKSRIQVSKDAFCLPP